MDKQTLTFTLERETKNTIRFKEDSNGQPPTIGTLYIQKHAVGNKPPSKLFVTLTGA
jgi:hypothetical protein